MGLPDPGRGSTVRTASIMYVGRTNHCCCQMEEVETEMYDVDKHWHSDRSKCSKTNREV